VVLHDREGSATIGIVDADVVVVGAGAVGLACAAELSQAGLTVVIAERHASPGQETSSRNSQVLHAGIYYPAGSLKADLCVRGNRSLSAFCEAHGVPFRRVGKWLLAVEPEEEARLAEVVAGGRANGVALEEVPLARFRQEEPHVRAAAAVLSPSTGILDVHGLFRALHVIAEENGASFARRHTLASAAPVRGGYELRFSGPSGEEARLTASRVVNAAGLDADTVADGPLARLLASVAASRTVMAATLDARLAGVPLALPTSAPAWKPSAAEKTSHFFRKVLKKRSASLRNFASSSTISTFFAVYSRSESSLGAGILFSSRKVFKSSAFIRRCPPRVL